jgi:hypothetical protein
MNGRTLRPPRHWAWRALGWVAALAIVAFAVAANVGRFASPSVASSLPVGAVHAPVGLGHDHGSGTAEVHGLHAQPARPRASVLAVLAVGIVVAALARRGSLLGMRAPAPELRLTGLRSGRGPPLLRIV